MKGLIGFILELLFGKKVESPSERAKKIVKGNSSSDNDLLSKLLDKGRRP